MAFTLQNGRFTHFPVDTVKIEVSQADCSAINETIYTLQDKVTQAINRYWNGVASSRLLIKNGGINSAVTVDATTTLETALAAISPNTILISCSSNNTIFSNPAIHAIANIDDANGTTGAVFLNAVGSPIFATKTDDQKIAIIGHEIGHAIGIGHSELADALMYYTPGGKTQMKLHKDDADALTYLYGNRPELSCSSLASLNSHHSDEAKNFLYQIALGFLAALGIGKMLRRKKS